VRAALRSALYEGWARHRRFDARAREFRVGLALCWLDLDELEDVFRGRLFWSVGRPNLVWLRRADYLGDPARPLDEAVRDRVETELGRRPLGPVRMLTQLRTLGYLFNPVSFYFCHEPGEEEPCALVAEITNTPWKERRAYVLGREQATRRGRTARWRFAKDFHVSPFQALEQEYDWRVLWPGERLVVHMQSRERGRTVFDATLAMRRAPLDGRALARALVCRPAQPLRVHARIYLEAAKLFLRRAPFHVHPAKRAAEVPEATR
jgi:DUF1365 family protein